MAISQWASLTLAVLASAVILAALTTPAVAQNYDYDQGQESTTFQGNQEEQASEFPGAETAEAQGSQQAEEFNSEPYPNTEQDFPKDSKMANEPGQTDMAPGETQGDFDQTNPSENVPRETDPSENIPGENVPEGNGPNETSPKETSPSETSPSETNPSETTPEETVPGESSNPSETASAETTSESASMEDNSAGAAFAPGAAAGNAQYNYTAEYENSWSKIKGGEVGPETIIGAAIGAVLGMSLCICCVCVCYIRQRNIARAQYGQPGGVIEL